MNKTEAFKVLGLEQSANDDDIRKKFRKLAAKKHPDVNKEENAEAEYKKLSEAYEYLKEHKDDPEFQEWGSPFGGSSPFGGGFPFPNVEFPNMQQTWQAPPASTKINISFKESVLGCDKDIILERFKNCADCKGTRSISTDKTCPNCNGQGMKRSEQNMGNRRIIMQSLCHDCNATGNIQKICNKCSGKGYKPEKTELNIHIPGGIQNSNIIRLNGAGHIHGHFQEEALVAITVDSDPDMILVGSDVISTIEISLIDALKGTSKEVRTVLGNKEIKINQSFKNGEEVILENHGVEKLGSHRFVITVEYPEDTQKLIEFLEKEEKEEKEN